MCNLTKGENYYKRDRNMNYRDRTETLATGTGTLETGKKWLLESPLHGLKKERIYYSSTCALVYSRLVNKILVD